MMMSTSLVRTIKRKFADRCSPFPSTQTFSPCTWSAQYLLVILRRATTHYHNSNDLPSLFENVFASRLSRNPRSLFGISRQSIVIFLPWEDSMFLVRLSYSFLCHLQSTAIFFHLFRPVSFISSIFLIWPATSPSSFNIFTSLCISICSFLVSFLLGTWRGSFVRVSGLLSLFWGVPYSQECTVGSPSWEGSVFLGLSRACFLLVVIWDLNLPRYQCPFLLSFFNFYSISYFSISYYISYFLYRMRQLHSFICSLCSILHGYMDLWISWRKMTETKKTEKKAKIYMHI